MRATVAVYFAAAISDFFSFSFSFSLLLLLFFGCCQVSRVNEKCDECKQEVYGRTDKMSEYLGIVCCQLSLCFSFSLVSVCRVC